MLGFLITMIQFRLLFVKCELFMRRILQMKYCAKYYLMKCLCILCDMRHLLCNLLTAKKDLTLCCTHVIYQVYTQKLVRSDKFKTGKDQFVDREILSEENRDIFFGRIPVMVKSDLCYMKGAENADCDFDHGGYFLIKGAEKVSLNYGFF